MAKEEEVTTADIPTDELLEYNLKDCLSTWYVHNKNKPKLITDHQEKIYNQIMIPSIKVILQMELTGMPLDMDQVLKTETIMEGYRKKFSHTVFNSPIIKKFTKVLRKRESDVMHAKWKKKTEPIEYFDYFEFNPASNPQVSQLLYDFLGYKIIDRTKKKQPAVGGKTLKKLIHVAKCSEDADLLKALIDLGEVSKILDTFIKAFKENSILKEDGVYYLHGNFNLGGTVSGRLSSSGPNLQNLPSNSTYAKLIKKCFKAPSGNTRIDLIKLSSIIDSIQ